MKNIPESFKLNKTEASLDSKVKDWIKRYLSAEIVATATAYIASDLTYKLTKSEAYAALAATHAGNIGYYGTIISRDLVKENNSLRKELGRVVAEFGPAFIIDSFFARPLLTKYATERLGRLEGVVTGKALSDAVFYSIVIPSYEFLKGKRGAK